MKSPRTVAHLAKLKPEFAALVDAMLELGYRNGMLPQISSSFRTPEEQDAEYAKGRTVLKTPDGKPQKIVTQAERWESLHQYRIAADLFFLVDGKGSWESDLFETLWHLAQKAGLDRNGLVWSGGWTGFKETAHFQLRSPDWRELAREAGIDPITKNKIPPPA